MLTREDIDEVESQKVGEAYDRAARMMVEFRSIEGFSYEIKIWSKVEKALNHSKLSFKQMGSDEFDTIDLDLQSRKFYRFGLEHLGTFAG